ncbi:MAG: manganese efflux pump [Clostridia bacterium]|nr:manganese efflux pump [Clostridia bacterium]MBQ5596859.1 manganese efflux pump [Clostridia bacterium]
MGLIEVIILAVGLAMDAFAVSVCKGLAMKKATFKNALICGIWFGGFQGLMPFIGYLLGSSFAEYINVISSWIAFALLCLIGGNMIREALSKDEETASADLDIKTMLIMAIATSIDALAVGIAFACEKINILAVSDIVNTLIGVGIIGIITCIISCFGVKIGNVFGSKFKSKAEFCGGLILILIGVKILLEYFGVL